MTASNKRSPIVNSSSPQSHAQIARGPALQHSSDCALHNDPAYPAGPCSCGLEKLPNEGSTKTIVLKRVVCDCGEYATQKHSYLLPHARSNPASSAYRRDDCSWCQDREEFTCFICKRPEVGGYEWCSTFEIKPDNLRFAHMFLKWVELKAEGRAP